MRAKKDALAKILDECLFLLQTGRESVEGCLSRYPEYKEELEPLLRTVSLIDTVPSPRPSPGFKEELRRKLLSAMEAKRPQEVFIGLPQRRGARLVFGEGWLMRMVAILAIFFLLGSGTVAASAASLPDSFLYPVKIAAERAELALTFGESEKAELHLRLAERRLGEAQRMITEEKPEATERALSLMNEHLEGAQGRTRASAAQDKEALYQKMLTLTERQQAVLTSVLEKVPEPAKDAISHALEVSRRGHQEAMEALGKGKKKVEPKPAKPAKPGPPEEIVPPIVPGVSPPGDSGGMERQGEQDQDSMTYPDSGQMGEQETTETMQQREMGR